jgi:transcriptional regulator with XRE-family HTH domain
MLLLLHTISSFTPLQICSMENKEVLIKFGQRVRQLRKNNNLSQEELSFKANLHRTYIGMIERAEKNITLVNIEKIAKALNVDIKELFNG